MSDSVSKKRRCGAPPFYHHLGKIGVLAALTPPRKQGDGQLKWLMKHQVKSRLLSFIEPLNLIFILFLKFSTITDLLHVYEPS